MGGFFHFIFRPSNLDIDAFSNKSLTLPFAHRRNISRLAITPCGNLLISVDDDGRAILTNLPRRLALHYFSFKGTVTALAFSPSGRYFAAGLGRIVQVWHTPTIPDIDSSEGLEFAPFVLHRVLAGHHDTVKHLEWSRDSRFFLTGSRDLTARIWSLGSEDGFVPTALSGHRESLIGAWFSNDQEAVWLALTMKPPASADISIRFTQQVRMVHYFNGSSAGSPASMAILMI